MNPRLSYREAAVSGAGPLRLIVLLYEQALEDLRRALLAHAKGDIEGRTREINHALLVIGHLQGTLDRDRGGRVASHLDRFYNQFRAALVEAQFKQSAAVIEKQIACLLQVHGAWCVVEKSLTQATVSPDDMGKASSSGWRA